jgi:hypothetical protein
MTFVVKFVIVPRVHWRNWRIVLQLLDKAINFGVMQPFLVSILEPIWYNEGERKRGSFIFILRGKSVINHIFFSLLVNYIISISKNLGDLFFFALGRKCTIPENA